VRKHAVMLNLIHIKAVVFHNSVLIVPPEGADNVLLTLRETFLHREDSEEQSPFHEDRQVPFEMVAYEAIFNAAIELLSQSFREVKTSCQQNNFSSFKNAPTTEAQLSVLAQVKKSHSEFASLLNGVRDALVATLGSDEDMSQMNLTKIYYEPHIFTDKAEFSIHLPVEVLLEGYLETIEGLLRQCGLAQSDLSAAEARLNMQLDINRNKILSCGLILATVSLGVGFATIVVGLFGMNVDSGIFFADETHYWWKFAIVFCLSVVALAFVVAIVNIRRLR